MAQDTDGYKFVTDDGSGGLFVFECDCGFVDISSNMNVISGFDDCACFCPRCREPDPDDCENANKVWNVQQEKINGLRMTISLVASELEKAGASGEFNADKLNELRYALIASAERTK